LITTLPGIEIQGYQSALTVKNCTLRYENSLNAEVSQTTHQYSDAGNLFEDNGAEKIQIAQNGFFRLYARIFLMTSP
jgi:hypothetical protein